MLRAALVVAAASALRAPSRLLPTRAVLKAATLAAPPAPKTADDVLTLESFVKADGRLDPIGLAAWAGYEKKPFARPLGFAYFGALFAFVAAPAAPVFARLLALQYFNYSLFEYCFHRWCMHAKDGTLCDRIFARWNRLHVQHHIDTHDDMTMEDGYNWKGIRFNYLTTKLSIAISCLFTVAVNRVFGLGLPFWPTPVAAALLSLYHGVIWNRLHTDSHDLQATLTWDDGIPYVYKVPVANRYARWLLTNHIGHHTIKGTGNYNIVFPGPDHVMGTFHRISKTPKADQESDAALLDL